MKRYFFIIILVSIAITAISGNKLKFVRYTTKQGLVNNYIRCACQDDFGFIWFGTNDGISRFDGIDFKIWEQDEYSQSAIGVKWVNQIVCDSENQLWFAISGPGATCLRYDYEKDVFIDISTPIKEKVNFKNHGTNFWSVFYDSKGLIWLGANNLIVCYSPEKDEVKEYPLDLLRFRDILEDKDSNIWIAGTKGLAFYNRKTDLITSYHHQLDNPRSICSDYCNCLFQDSKGYIWLGTYNGVNRFFPDSVNHIGFDRFSHIPGDPNSLSNNIVSDIAEDSNNNMFFATVEGLSVLDIGTGKFYRYYNDKNDSESINSNLITSLFRDKHGNMWIGTNSGIGMVKEKNFRSFSHFPSKNSISHDKVQYLVEGPNSNIWVATPKGIDIYSKDNNQFKFIAGITHNNKGLYGPPIVMYPDSYKRMWIGTWNGGFCYMDLETNEFTNFFEKAFTKSILNVFSIYLDSKKNLWVSSHRDRIYVFNENIEIIKEFTIDGLNEKSLTSNSVTCMLEDSGTDIWIGTQSGLNKLEDFNAGHFKRYLNGLAINCIIESYNKHVWIGTNNGLYRYNKSSHEIKYFNIKHRLPGTKISGILEDQSFNLWLSTDKGLCRITPVKDSIKSVILFRDEDGLEIEDFIPNSCLKTSDGYLLFGGTKGFCIFHPKEIKKDTIAPDLIIAYLKVLNRTIKVGEEINNQVILHKSIIQTTQLELNHKNNRFAIGFVGLQYNMPQYNQYAYRLDGLDLPNEWHFTKSSNREVEYMNLSEGEYVFQVKAANSQGVWNRNCKKLKIRILPPWWRTTLFKLALIASLIIIVILSVRIRTYNLQKQKKNLERVVKIRTMELQDSNLLLEQSKEELAVQANQLAEKNRELSETNMDLEIKRTEVENMAKQLHEADQSKLRFFANISHEFRTPLALIVGPLEKCIQIQKSPHWNRTNISNYLQLMNRNASRLIRLVNQIIDFRKLDQGGQKLNVTHNKIVSFINEVVDAFSILAKKKGIELRVRSEELRVKNIEQPTNISQSSLFTNHSSLYTQFWFDPDVMEKILYNLISNAIKYTPEGGEILIAIDVVGVETRCIASPPNNQLAIKISDTGIGIEPEYLNKIFERFYRVSNTGKNKEEGSGIGLAYTRELVILHKGDISVDSQPGKGTTFNLCFPFKELFKLRSTNAADTREIEQSKTFNLKYIHSRMDEVQKTVPYDIGYKNKIKPELSIEKNNHLEFKGNLTKPRLKILIVEDNTDFRDFLKGELEKHYAIIEAENGKEGWETALENSPDLIISDIMMPIMDGMEFCQKIKTDENTCHIPVILLTAKTAEESIFKGIETGADDYITKPFKINMLIMKIANIFKLRKNMYEKFKKSYDINPSDIAISKLDETFLQKAIKVVNDNLLNPEFNNATFVESMNYGKSQVYKKIKMLTDQSVSEFIRNIRLKVAAQKFLEGYDNISDVSQMVGFKHQNDLYRYFTKMFGKSPSQFIKDNLPNLSK